MATNDSNNEWVKEGTPREDWDTDNDYGVEVHPTEWDDYSDEQAVPVPTPPAARAEYDRQAEAPASEATTNDEGDVAPEHQPTADVPEQSGWSEPVIAQADADETHAADEIANDAPELSVDRDEDMGQAESLPADGLDASEPEDVHDEHREADGAVLADEAVVEETQIRERPIVPEADSHDTNVDPVAVADLDDRETDEVANDEAALEHEPEADVDTDHAVDVEDEGEQTALMDKPLSAQDQDESFRPAAAGGATAVAAGAGAAGLASLYRNDDATEEVSRDEMDQTQHLDQSRLAQEQAEEDARLAKLREQREARDARLGVVPHGEGDGSRVIEKPVKRQSDKFFGAFSLFVLRLVTASIIGALGYQVLSDVDAASQFLGQTIIPEPRLVSWILGFGLVAMAAMLVLGLGTRLVGFLLFAVAVASLALIRWGQFSIFQDGLEGFLGDRTLLTAAVGLILTAFGGGRWGIDGAIRAAREKSKAAKNQ